LGARTDIARTLPHVAIPADPAPPRDIVTSFWCLYNGVEVFRADLSPAIAANPFVTFFTVATESGTLEFKWTGDNGFSETAVATITVE
jgi:sulfur-oxidizing protein SoxZ